MNLWMKRKEQNPKLGGLSSNSWTQQSRDEEMETGESMMKQPDREKKKHHMMQHKIM